MEDLGQLIQLYNKWIKDPETYNEKMTDTVDKIIYSTLGKQSLNPVYWKYEDTEDLVQDLRLLCFRKLKSITNPTNKRIFNFLRISIKLFLKDRTRRVGKLMDREPAEASILGEKIKEPEIEFFFGSQILNDIATMLASGETKRAIMSSLNINKEDLEKYIKRIRSYYEEK